MNIFLRLTLDCEPAVAWDAITSPAVFRAISSPLLAMRSLEPGGFPGAWIGDGPHRISISCLGIIFLGTQTIDVRFTERPGDVRMLVDTGAAFSGPLAIMHDWDHRMAVSAGPSGKTLYRDRLVVKAGLATPFIWLGMWVFWQYRARRLRALSSSWTPRT